MLLLSQDLGEAALEFCFCHQTDNTIKQQHIYLISNIKKTARCSGSGFSSLHHGDMDCHAYTLSLCHTHMHRFPRLCAGGLLKTVSNAATYSSAHTLNCVNVWVHIIFQGCHSPDYSALFSITERLGTVGPECMIYLSARALSLCVFPPLFGHVSKMTSAKQRLRMRYSVNYLHAEFFLWFCFLFIS